MRIAAQVAAVQRRRQRKAGADPPIPDRPPVERNAQPHAAECAHLLGAAVAELGRQCRLGRRQELRRDQSSHRQYLHDFSPHPRRGLVARAQSSSRLQTVPLTQSAQSPATLTATTPTPIATQPSVEGPPPRSSSSFSLSWAAPRRLTSWPASERRRRSSPL